MSDTYQSGDRRPIASRDWKFSRVATEWLVARGISANGISIAGMMVGILAGAFLAATSHVAPPYDRALWVVGAVCVQLRLLANMLDGMVAVRSRTASPLGELFNEIPDRVSDSATLIGLGFAVSSSPLLGWSAALTAMFTAYVRAVGKVAGAQQEFCGPMAKPQRMFLVTVAALFFGLAPPTWQQVSEVPVVRVVLIVIIFGALWTALRRLVRIARTLRTKS